MTEEQHLPIFWQIWTAPKDGHRHDQNEDAGRAEIVRSEEGKDGLLVAIADGATEAVYSRLWARTLVEAAQFDWTVLTDDELNQRVQQVREKFSPLEPGKEMPWYVRNKFLTQGSQATLMVLTLQGSTAANCLDLRAVAVGDCCLLVFKKNGEIYGFPMCKSEDFGTNPMLIRSHHQATLPYERSQTQVQVGDVLLICSDAIGKWALNCVEEGQQGLLFQTVFQLLKPVVPHDVMVAPLPIERVSASEKEEETTGHSVDMGNEEPFPAVMRLLRSLGLGAPKTQPDKSKVADCSEEKLNSKQSAAHNENLSENAPRRLPPESIADSLSNFERFVITYRSPEKKPRMRNDDSTLIVCLPVSSARQSEQQVLDIIANHKAAAQHPSQVIQLTSALEH